MAGAAVLPPIDTTLPLYRQISLKAHPSITKCYVRFFNCSQRSIDLIWINYNGSPVLYASMSPNCYFDVSTFVGHFWIFCDALTGQPLYCLPQKSAVYSPEPSPAHRVVRKVLKITTPMYSLAYRCMQILATNGLKCSDARNFVDLPQLLKNELCAYLLSVESYQTDKSSIPGPPR